MLHDMSHRVVAGGAAMADRVEEVVAVEASRGAWQDVLAILWRCQPEVQVPEIESYVEIVSSLLTADIHMPDA